MQIPVLCSFNFLTHYCLVSNFTCLDMTQRYIFCGKFERISLACFKLVDPLKKLHKNENKNTLQSLTQIG